MRIPRPLLAPLAALAVATAPAQTPNLLDPTFRAELTAPPDLVMPLSDGRLYVASSRQDFTVAGHRQRGIARLLVDGSIDPSFDLGDGIEAGAKIESLDVLADGRVALMGTFTTINGAARPTLARLLASGALDPSFQPGAALLAPNPALRFPLPDGRWIVGTVANENLNFARFTATGSPDSTYRSGSIDLRQPSSPGNSNLAPRFSSARVLSRDLLGRVYFGTRFSFFGSSENFHRLNSDGVLEPAILFRLINPMVGTFERDEQAAVECDGQHALIQYSRASGGMFGGSSTRGFSVLPLSPGAPVPMIPAHGTSSEFSRVTSVGYGFGPQAQLNHDGIYTKSYGARGRNGIVRLDFAGNLDPDFSCEIVEFNIPFGEFPPSGVADFYLLSNEQILLRATSINGTPANFLARLTPSQRSGATSLRNVSVFSRLLPGAPPLLLGYVVAHGRKNLLARATGPALAQFGVADALADPVLSVASGGAFVAHNDDWSANTAIFGSVVGAFALPAGSRDAALATGHAAGAYQLQVTDKTGVGGATLAELYDLDPRPAGAASPRLVNFSARTMVGGPSGPLIAGFTIDGDSARTVVIRAVGPGLAQFGLTDTIPDPVIQLFRGNAMIGTNRNWGAVKGTGVQSWSNSAYRLEEMFRAVRAFALDSSRPDAALYATLPPGAYTVHVAGVSNTAGEVLFEVYEVP